MIYVHNNNNNNNNTLYIYIYRVHFSLVLTLVAFKLVVSESLPNVSYMTLLDKYMIGNVLRCQCEW
jgi:hypothetical protein